MVKKILTYPNPTLGVVSEDVKVFDEELHTLLDDMKDTLDANLGLGLASIQIGVPLNVLIIKHEGELIEAINPRKITCRGGYGGTQHEIEGCLSIPNVSERVERASTIEVKYMDRNGVEYTMVADHLLARVWQHEIEHLNGGLFIDNLSNGKLKKLKAIYKKNQKKK